KASTDTSRIDPSNCQVLLNEWFFTSYFMNGGKVNGSLIHWPPYMIEKFELSSLYLNFRQRIPGLTQASFLQGLIETAERFSKIALFINQAVFNVEEFHD